ncbi:MAG: hypothetical protein JWR35_2871 [Marmoricola sp.]|jgi:hypothetical protein|nr:hypothetical protein [Marmoricola sp.]
MRKPGRALPVQSYGPTSGTISGVLGLVLVSVIGVSVLIDDHGIGGVRTALLMALAGVLIWAFLLRPRIMIKPPAVVLRNAFIDQTIPLDQVEQIVIRAFTVLRVNGKRYVGVAVGHPVRKLGRGGGNVQVGNAGRRGIRMNSGMGPAPTTKSRNTTVNMPDFVEERLRDAVAHEKLGAPSEGHVVRSWAVPELAVLAVLAVAFVVSILI